MIVQKRRSSRELRVQTKAEAFTDLLAIPISSERWIFLTTGFISFALYLSTVAPGIVGGDSGELVAEGCKLGTAHPPGYPLYTILVFLVTNIGRFISLSHPHSPAYYVNMTSCIFGALASSFISVSVYNIVNIEYDKDHKTNSKLKTDQASTVWEELKVVCSIATGVLYSTSPLAHQYHITAEVFAMHNFFVGLILYNAIKFGIHGTLALFLRGAFICGLALTNQHTAILLEIPVIIWVLHLTQLYRPLQWKVHLKSGKYHGLRLIIMAGSRFLLGFLPLYLTLPLFSFLYPHAGSWGDVQSIRGFLNHIRRKDYGSFRLFSGDDDGAEDLWERSFLWFKDFIIVQGQMISFVLIGASIMALFVMISRVAIQKENKNAITSTTNKRRLFGFKTEGSLILLPPEKRVCICAMLLYSLVFYLLVFHSLSNLPLNNELFFGIHQRFWIHPNTLLYILIGVAIIRVSSVLVSASSLITARFFMLCLCLLMMFSCHHAISDNSQKDNVIFKNYASSILKTLPSNSLLFINYDQQWTSIRYLQECENVRTDVTSINTSMMSYKWWEKKIGLYPHVTFPGSYYTMANTVNWMEGGFTFSELIQANYENFSGKIFIGGHPNYQDIDYQNKYDEIPHGIVRRIVKNGTEGKVHESEYFRRRSVVIWDVIMRQYLIPDLEQYDNTTWESTIHIEFFTHFTSTANHMLDLAVKEESTKDEKLFASFVEAALWLEVAILNDNSTKASAATWKNLGLAYMRIVKSKVETKSLPRIRNIFQGRNEFLIENIDPFWIRILTKEWTNSNIEPFKNFASNRWEICWKTFLSLKEAKHDSSYKAIKKIYNHVMKGAKK